MVTYQPEPIDTSGVEIETVTVEDLERLARNNHDHWSLARIKEGWRYGPTRDDDEKTNPDLVPYEKLSESEKDYDRRAVLQTLKAAVALGYEIHRRS